MARVIWAELESGGKLRPVRCNSAVVEEGHRLGDGVSLLRVSMFCKSIVTLITSSGKRTSPTGLPRDPT